MEGTDNDYPNEHEEAYHKLLEKIHEKIESLQESINESEVHLKLTGNEIVLDKILELKSLLEDEK
jgi:hypothetical protein